MELKIGWLYPELMSTYGDRGNIIALFYRGRKRKINIKIIKISIDDPVALMKEVDLLFMGGAQDKQQEIVNVDLQKNKGKMLEKLIEREIPALFICGAYQFLGKYYLAADGTKIPGLGIFDLYTINPGLNKKRLIGDIIIKPKPIWLKNKLVIGFENHGGRTYLSDKQLAFAEVIKGAGNNGQDKTEGIFYKNAIGTYLHGPILPKNPHLTDFLLKIALEKKYQKEIILKELDDELEKKAREKIINNRLE